jgi:xanthine/uracil permease
MPNPVLGGAAVVLFGMIFSVGIRILTRGAELTQRNLTIVAVSVVLGLGVEVRPDVLSSLPEDLRLLAGSGLIAGGVTALVLNIVLPSDEKPTPDATGVAPESMDD